MSHMQLEDTDVVSKLINNFSSWYRVKRAVAWILCVKDLFLQRFRKNTGDVQTDPSCQTTIVKQKRHDQSEKSSIDKA